MNFLLMRNRSFFFLWLAQIGATLGNELYNVGVMVVIYERTGSALQATGVLLARTLPPGSPSSSCTTGVAVASSGPSSCAGPQ